MARVEEAPQGSRGSRPVVIVIATLLATLALAAAAVGGYLLGEDSGEGELDAGRAAEAARQGRIEAARELTTGRRRAARLEGRKKGYELAYRMALRTTRERVAAGGPRNCGDAIKDAPTVAKIRAQGISCAIALAFGRGVRDCKQLEGQCQDYTCSAVAIGYEQSEFTCRRGEVTIRFLSGV